MFERILVATDGSELGAKAVSQAKALADQTGAAVHVVVVCPAIPMFAPSQNDGRFPEAFFTELRAARIAEFQKILDAAVQACSGIAMPIEEKEPYQGILDAAEACDASMIVMGSTGQTDDRFPLGSQAIKVLALSDIPVHVVK